MMVRSVLTGVPSSSSLDGSSPTSVASQDLIQCYGGRRHHFRRPRGPHRRALAWLLRMVKRVNSSEPTLGSLSLEAPASSAWHGQQCIPEYPLEADPRCSLLSRIARGVVKPLKAVMTVLLARVQPQGPGVNDQNLLERVVNVVTSLPFVAVGFHSMRQRSLPQARRFGACFVAVGMVAAVYHGASGPLRPHLRRLDYWTICYTSNVLRAAAGIQVPPLVKAATVAMTPFKPTAVTGFNLLLVEAKYLRTALQHAHLMASWRTHFTTAIVGVGCFLYEDVAIAMKWPPIFHSLWHCLSAVAMGMTNALLGHMEMVLAQGLVLEGLQADLGWGS